jgi:AraC-like DNA-binding protein
MQGKMLSTGTSAEAHGEAVTAPGSRSSLSLSAAEPAQSLPGECLRRRKYRELARKHLNHMLDRLFAEVTGLHFHVAWRRTSLSGKQAQVSPTNCSACCRRHGAQRRPECGACGAQHLSATLAAKRGHRFTCRRGIHNYWLPLRVHDELLGIAYLQAAFYSGRQADLVLSRRKFTQAARLMRQFIEQVQTASVSDLREADLTRAGRAVIALEREQARLHQALKRYLPAPAAAARRSPESHAEQVVHALLQQIQFDYAKPLTLQRLARDLGMNSAYLSTLFARTVGIPFKTYLTELRLQKAKDLLADFTKSNSDVAFATGYSSQERFRSAFKKATGLSPKAWRETMQLNPL